MKVWNDGKFVDMAIGQRVTVFRVSSGRTCFGEPATLAKATAQHLIFTTDSGAIVKTKLDNINAVIGKAAAERYCVSLKQADEFYDLILENVRFWDKKTCTFVTK